MHIPAIVSVDAGASPASAPSREGKQNSFPRFAENIDASIHTGRPSKISGRSPAGPKVSPEKILQTFNTWSFKREQPDNHPLMLKIISEQAWLNRPLSFVLYWGKGPRDAPGNSEIACLKYLETMGDRVRALYKPGVEFKLIFTETHAELNGHSQQRIDRYFGAVEELAKERGFQTCRLGELVRTAQEACVTAESGSGVSEETLRKLEACAQKWFRGEGSAEEGAAEYFRMNMMEKRAVEHAFPRSIFITFNGSEYRDLFPSQLPIFYMYSLRRGTAVKPWFIDESAMNPSSASNGAVEGSTAGVPS